MTPGDRLKIARKELHLTQKVLGEKLGLKWYQIKDMESGKVEVSEMFARLFCLEFGVHDYWLLKGKGAMIPERRELRVSDRSIRYGMGSHGSDATAFDKIINLLMALNDEEQREVLRFIEGQRLLREREKKEHKEEDK